MAIKIDYSLTPETCSQRGFTWAKDSMYDPEAPYEARQELENLVEKGWLLGSPATINTIQNNGVGLYERIVS